MSRLAQVRNLLDPLFDFTQTVCDKLFEFKHYPESTKPKPRVIAHRGAWGSDFPENSMSAFLEAQRLGAWGVEFDVRFTEDSVGVICHDPTLERCFDRPERVCDMRASDLPKELCHLDEVLAMKRLHFMIEIKEKLNSRRVEILQESLKHLNPIADYHLLALSPELVRVAEGLPAKSWILVGELNSHRLVAESLRRGLGGVAGHYLLMTNKMIANLHAAKQVAGTGFIPSKNILKREWNRNIDWVFTNHLAAFTEVANANSDVDANSGDDSSKA